MCTGTVEQLTKFPLNVGKEEIMHEGFVGVAEHIVQEPANRTDILQKGLQIYNYNRHHWEPTLICPL